MADPTPILVVLDVLAPVKKDEIDHLLPGRREPRWLRFGEQLGKAPGSFGPPFDWATLGRALAAIAATAKEESAKMGDAGVHVYVAGRAPLPLFVMLGQAFNFSPTPATVLNPRRGGPWEAYPMSGDARTEGKPFFEVEAPLQVQRTNARVAIFVSTVGTPAPVEAIERLFEARNEPLAAIVEIRTSGPGDVTPEAMPVIAEELRRRLSAVPGHFPKAKGFALFLAGPTPLAFAAGLALNPRVFGKDVWVGNYAAPDYEYTFTVPFRSEGSPIVPDGDGDRLARREVMDAILDGIQHLRNTLELDDFPGWGAGDTMRRTWVQYLRDLKIVREPEGDAFGLSILLRRLALGRGLLQALRDRPREMWQGFGQLLVLHELFHDGQDLRTSNYYDVGRAGTVLEDVDFSADAFALATLIAWDLRRGGLRALEEAGDVAARWVACAIGGIEAFDRLEQGGPIERLYERRLRRYLIWYLQQERARTIRHDRNAKSDVERLFAGRLTVELAPLAGHLDARFDKLVAGSTPQTELFAALDGHLIREARRPGFEPGLLVEAVREYRGTRIEEAMRYVLGEHRAVLVPWAAEGERG